MATDKRELILTRLLAIGEGITGIESAWRNRGELKQDNRPAFVVLDGDENDALSNAIVGRGRVGMAPTVMELKPQIFVLLVPRTTPKNEGVGEELSDWRAKVIKAIADDQTLIDLLGSNGQVLFRGMQTDMRSGSALYGELQFDFGFRYTFNPRDL